MKLKKRAKTICIKLGIKPTQKMKKSIVQMEITMKVHKRVEFTAKINIFFTQLEQVSMV